MNISRSGAALLALATVLVSPCMAQSAAPAAAAEEEELEEQEVVVTGTRLATGFDTPTPVTMFEAEALTAAVPNSMGEALAQLPSLAGSIQNTTSGQGSSPQQTNGQNLLNLRQLGTGRTLILLDGQRMGVTNVGGSVDINIIPQSLVKRVDVVTGGASASYGSDAVAGVVNFILDTTFEGFKTDINGGITGQGDMGNGKATVAFGRRLSDRARVIAGIEYFKMNGLKYGEDTGRDWFDHPTGAWANPVANASPRVIVVPDARARFGSYGGTITAVQGCPAGATGDACRALVNQKFVPGGTTPYVTGTFGQGLFSSGGEGPAVNQPFTPFAERKSVFIHGEFDLNDSVTSWAEGGYNLSETFLQAQVATQTTNTQFAIQEDNAYLPASVSQIFAANAGNQTFSLTRYDHDMGFQEVTGDVEVKRFAAGFKGRINDTWSFDTTLGLQDTHQDLNIRNTIMRNLYAAADAVVNPANGQIVCRSTIYATPTSTTPVPGGTGMDPGCVPLNLFGDGSPSQAAIDYAWGLNTSEVDLRQTTLDANIRGNFGEGVSLGAGPVSFATGMNYRRLTAERAVDPLSAIYIDGTGVRGFPAGLQGRYGGFQYYNPSPVSGTVSVSEAYVELGVPLLADLPGVKSLGTTVAGRLTDYSQSGVENMWKLGLNWSLNDSMRVRGTLSADTRAPSVIELFNTAQVTQGNYVLPYSTSAVSFQGRGQNISIGNTALTPERARTYTAGVVFSPAFVPGFLASLDWYEIKLLGSIAAPGTQNSVDRCYFGDQASCALIKVNGQAVTNTTGIVANDFVVVTNPLLNQNARSSTSGLDFETAYRTPLANGTLALRLTGNYLLKVYEPESECAIGSLGQTDDFVGAIGNCGLQPKIRARLSANYDIGRFGIYLQERYIDKGKRNPNFVPGVDISINDVPSIMYTDMTLKFDLGSRLASSGELYMNVTNVFDKDPPVTISTVRSWVEPTETDLYDVLGRRFVVGMRLSW